jgi:endonuclease/exonuclease/phosphatase family metal-dependent hydrolase
MLFSLVLFGGTFFAAVQTSDTFNQFAFNQRQQQPQPNGQSSWPQPSQNSFSGPNAFNGQASRGTNSFNGQVETSNSLGSSAGNPFSAQRPFNGPLNGPNPRPPLTRGPNSFNVPSNSLNGLNAPFPRPNSFNAPLSFDSQFNQLFSTPTAPESNTPKIQLRVATFNVWGLVIAKSRVDRIEAIARYFSRNPRDLEVVAFQELWMMEDYRTLKAALSLSFPYSHYFMSGVVGSGLAIFSRYPIKDSWWLGFTASGKPQRFFDGDWYAGKGIGAVRIKHPFAGSVDIFDTHLIADYSPNDYEKDWYKAHRATQLYELVRHVDRTGDPSAFTIVMGDFNTQPVEDAYISLLKSHDLYTPIRRSLRNVWRDMIHFRDPQSTMSSGPLEGRDPDHWTSTAMQMQAEGIQHNTFNLPSSTFYKSSEPTQQIDHIMYIPDGRIRCIDARVFLKRPSKSASGVDGPSYSDHAALMAIFELAPLAPVSLVRGNGDAFGNRIGRNDPTSKKHISQATHKLMIRLNEEIQALYSQQWAYRVGAVVCALFGLGSLIGAILLLRRANQPEEMQKLLTSQAHPEDYKWWQRISPNWYAFGLLLLGAGLAINFHWLIWNAIVFLPQEIYALKTFQYEWALWLRRH